MKQTTPTHLKKRHHSQAKRDEDKTKKNKKNKKKQGEKLKKNVFRHFGGV